MSATVDFPTLEHAACRLCEAEHGPGSYDQPRRKRAWYRRRAERHIERARALATADAVMAIFGYRRA